MGNTTAENKEPGKLFSIIIPVFREKENINNCLSGISELEKLDETEVIIVDGDGGSTIKAVQSSNWPFKLIKIESEKGRGTQLNRGARIADGDALIFLHADTVLPVNALTHIEETLKNIQAGAFALKITSSNFFISYRGFMGTLRSWITRIPFGDQVHFIKRETFFKIGGYQDIPIMEDVALMLTIRKRKIPIKILKEKVTTSDRRWIKEGALKTTLHHWGLYTLYRFGYSPHKLSRRYKPHGE